VLLGSGLFPTPLLQERTGLGPWYRPHILGGPWAFLSTAAGYGDFSRARRRTFVIEISALGR
jgi:hypothetical protein